MSVAVEECNLNCRFPCISIPMYLSAKLHFAEEEVAIARQSNFRASEIIRPEVKGVFG